MNVLTEFLASLFLGHAIWHWLVFAGIVLGLLVLDLGVLNKDDRVLGIRQSLLLSAGYMGMALLFGVGVWWQLGPQSALAYLTGFLIEKSLSIDNVFVMALIFAALSIPRRFQHRVLFWGILGVLALRGIMIALGASLIGHFSGALYVFGAILCVTGVKMWFSVDRPPDVANNPLLGFLRRHVRTTSEVTSHSFFVRQPEPATGRRVLWATPLFVAVCLVEFADLLFAVDSIPAIFSVTTDPFIVYTSNIFAILGVRALYFALAAMIHRFRHLKYALSLMLVFIGTKIFVVGLGAEVPAAVSLTVTVGLIAGGVMLSLWSARAAPALRQP